MVERETLDNGGTRYKTEQSAVDLILLAPRVLLARYHGYGARELVEPVTTDLTEMVKRERMDVFIDAGELKRYDLEFRSDWAEWFRRYRQYVDTMHILVRSSLVAVGVQIVNLAVGEVLKPYTSREAFEAVIQKAIERNTKGSPR